MAGDIFEDLAAEQDRLEAILAGLSEAQWHSPSAAAGWSIRDVVLHLAQTEEAVVASLAGGPGLSEARSSIIEESEGDPSGGDSVGRDPLDRAMDRWVRADSASAPVVFERWCQARRAAVQSLRQADPGRRFGWAAATLKPKTLATTRLAEHWAHGLDVTEPLGLDFPDTDRLYHIAWLGHGTLPYAFGFVGEEPHEVRCELTGPGGAVWCFGPADAPSRIVGDAGAFCRIGARRLAPGASGLALSGPYAASALRVLRNYAG
jgi:uncharacterized protein (TIGR03084 family)